MSNYFISKEDKTGEVVYLEYDIDKAYKVSPKAKKEDAIEVNKIVFISPMFTEKVIKKKIDRRISKLLLELNTIDDDDDDNGTAVRNRLMEAERLKLNIINNYRKHLGNSYTSLTLKKMQIIIDGFRSKLYVIRDKKQKEILMQLYNPAIDEESEKKGRKGR